MGGSAQGVARVIWRAVEIGHGLGRGTEAGEVRGMHVVEVRW